MRHRDLLRRERDRVVRSLTAPTRFRRDEEAPSDASWERQGGGGAEWSERDYRKVGGLLRLLEAERQARFTDEPPLDPKSVLEEHSSFLIYFDSGEEDVRGQRDVLDRAVRAIGLSDGRRVTVTGHTDSHGTHRENFDLGSVRASSVKKQLLLRGVPESQIVCRSYGFLSPRHSLYPQGEEADVLNRRVEIRIGDDGRT